MAGMLYLVPTPIGNLGDISVRCRKTLAEADFIAAEDTRVTLKLLNYLELKKTLVSYYEHNKAESGPRIVARILAGEHDLIRPAHTRRMARAILGAQVHFVQGEDHGSYIVHSVRFIEEAQL